MNGRTFQIQMGRISRYHMGNHRKKFHLSLFKTIIKHTQRPEKDANENSSNRPNFICFTLLKPIWSVYFNNFCGTIHRPITSLSYICLSSNFHLSRTEFFISYVKDFTLVLRSTLGFSYIIYSFLLWHPSQTYPFSL